MSLNTQQLKRLISLYYETPYREALESVMIDGMTKHSAESRFGLPRKSLDRKQQRIEKLATQHIYIQSGKW